MFETITLSDGRNETVHSMRDLLPLIERYMGYEAYRFMREKLDEAEDELREARGAYGELQEIRDRADLLTCEIRRQCNSLEEILLWEPLEKHEIDAVLSGICEAVRCYDGQK